ncbi:hypothetical protein C9374_000291 [Naegleria lovaniensis]|uniref:Agmatine deiminase n=1 Tax=Naegleria lovaniensis TaxID=51637 RepID=A0AA88GTZ7_NAELO|nr:uncharacterized protein C9374_000291 [Naegleria lovaniensis]KAG2388852.1 hypothetical protein C9374_000291 [Naegleria lovaniensis]
MIFPGEHEKHESIWMALGPTSSENNYEYTFKKCEEDPLRYSPFHQVQLPMIEALLSGNNPVHLENNDIKHEKFYIDLIIHQDQDKDYVKNCLRKRNNIHSTLIEEHIRFHVIEHLDMWMRDNGPIFVVNREQGTRAIVDFGFTLWSYCKQQDEEAIIEEAVDRKVAHLLNIPVIRSHLISEGGNREFNGRGILMMVEHVEMQRNKCNQITHRTQIEQEMKRVFGENSARHIIWLETEGLVEDAHAYRGLIPNTDVLCSMGTGGHIDEWCRFANESTILLAQVPDSLQDSISVENRKRLEQNYELLLKKCEVELKEEQVLKILRVPTAPHIIHHISEGDGVYETLKLLEFEDGFDLEKHANNSLKFIIASSYLNFLVSNRVVLISKYYREGLPESVRQLDEQVLQIFKEVYPDRTVVQIATEVLNMGGGGMHCITQQMPAL